MINLSQTRLSKFISRIRRFLPFKPKLVFIVEDNYLYAKSLQAFLNIQFPSFVIRIFPVGEDCLAELHRNPSVIIMDQMLDNSTMGAANGLAIIKQIKETSSSTRIILLSVQTELDVFVKSLALYECTYLQKDQKSFRTIEHCIRTF